VLKFGRAEGMWIYGAVHWVSTEKLEFCSGNGTVEIIFTLNFLIAITILFY
jgi:hypothetical protein